MSALMFFSFAVCFLMGIPLALVMGITGMAVILAMGVPLQLVAQRMFAGIDSFPLMAVPFFILAGDLMNRGGTTARIVRFADSLVGHIRGGLAHTCIVANMIFAGISGSAVADASRQPFVATIKAAPAAAKTEDGVVVAGDQTMPVFVQEKIPPIMFVRAIMVAGKQTMAIMDIEGVGNGIIVRNGYGFNNGEGKVVRIAPEKVTIRWSGKTLDIAPGL